MTEYLSLGDVIAIHDYVMRRQGWATAPLRDEGALKSAIMRPRTAAHYEDADLTRQAVLLAVGISQAQAFLDGNKRAAYQAMDAFLLRNGRRYDGKPLELAEWFVCIAEQSSERDALVDSFEDWLRVRVVPI